MKFLYSKAIIVGVSVLLPALAFSQTSSNGSNYATAIPTAVPFLNITPDSRSGAMGDAGVALTPDVNAKLLEPCQTCLSRK